MAVLRGARWRGLTPRGGTTSWRQRTRWRLGRFFLAILVGECLIRFDVQTGARLTCSSPGPSSFRRGVWFQSIKRHVHPAPDERSTCCNGDTHDSIHREGSVVLALIQSADTLR